MKRVIAMLLCLVMVFTLCACSAQGFPQGGIGLLERIKAALQNFDFGIIINIPTDGDRTITTNGRMVLPAP